MELIRCLLISNTNLTLNAKAPSYNDNAAAEWASHLRPTQLEQPVQPYSLKRESVVRPRTPQLTHKLPLRYAGLVPFIRSEQERQYPSRVHQRRKPCLYVEHPEAYQNVGQTQRSQRRAELRCKGQTRIAARTRRPPYDQREAPAGLPEVEAEIVDAQEKEGECHGSDCCGNTDRQYEANCGQAQDRGITISVYVD